MREGSVYTCAALPWVCCSATMPRRSGRGIPCPLVKGCRRDPNASHGPCEASLLSFRIPQPALMNSDPSLAFLLLAEDLGSQHLQELLLCRATSAASPAWLSSRSRLPRISAFCCF